MRLIGKILGMMNHLSDNELAALAASGAAAAFENLFDRHYMSVYRLAYRYCGIREDAEDIAQEVFVKLARAISTFRQDSSFGTWLHRITVNAARDHHRKESAQRDKEARYLENINIESSVGNPVSGEGVIEALAKLSPKLREAVVLIYGEGLSHREAAAVLGCTEVTVSWRLFQARKKLRKSLGDKG